MIIAGDLFDKSHPTLQELQIAFQFFSGLENSNIKTYLVGGNHETISDGTDTYKYLKEVLPANIKYLQNSALDLLEYGVVVHFLSHCSLPKDIGAYAQSIEKHKNSKNILVTHFRTTVGEYVREEIDTARLCEPFDLVVAGDIHSTFEKGNLVYTNQPLNTCFASEAQTGFLKLSIEDSKFTTERIATKLPSLIQWNRDAVDLAQVRQDLVCHFDKNKKEMDGYTDFIKINLAGTLKELRSVSLDSLNVKMNKIPIVEDVAHEEMYAELQRKDSMTSMSTDLQLIEYLKLVPYSDENIHSLLEIWKEVV